MKTYKGKVSEKKGILGQADSRAGKKEERPMKGGGNTFWQKKRYCSEILKRNMKIRSSQSKNKMKLLLLLVFKRRNSYRKSGLQFQRSTKPSNGKTLRRETRMASKSG